MKKSIVVFNRNRFSFLLILAVFIIFTFPFWGQGRIPFPASHLVNNFTPWQYYYGFPVRNPAMPDVGSQIFPWRQLAIKDWQSGQWPGWNPYNFSGTPLLANYQSAPFHPGNWLFAFLPVLNAWSILVLLPLLLGPLFTFLYLREIKFSAGAALISSFSFGFSGFFTCWLAYGTLVWVMVWLPLALYLVEKFRQGQIWVGPFFSLVTAFSLFSGHFQISLYFLMAVFLYWLSRGRGSGKLLIFFVLGICLAGPQILPTVEFYQQSVRSEAFHPGESIPFRYLITLLAPDFFGNPVTANNWFGHYAEWSGFIGVVALVLGAYGLFFGRQDRRRHFFIFLVFLSLVIVVRSPVQKFLVSLKIPVLSTSAFSRIIVLYSFAMAVLASFGLEALLVDWSKKRLKRLVVFLFVFSFILAVAWGWTFLSKGEWRQVSRRNLILPSAIFLTFSGLIISGALLEKIHNSKFIILSAILLLTIFDVFRFSRKWLPFDSREHFYPQLEVIKVLQEKTEKGERVFGNFGGELNVFQIPGIEGYDPLFIRRYGQLIATAVTGKIGDPSPLTVYISKNGDYTYKLLNFLGVKYLLHAKADGQNIWAFPFWQYPEGFEKTWEDDQYEVWLNKQALPRAFLVNDYQVIKEDQKIVDFMLVEETELKQTAVLEVEPDFEIQTCGHKGGAEIIDYQPHRVVIDLEADCWSLLVLTDNFYPGWQATIDGETTKTYRTNYSFRGVVVPDGEHEVVFEYRPAAFRWGLMIACLALAGILWSLKDNENWFF